MTLVEAIADLFRIRRPRGRPSLQHYVRRIRAVFVLSIRRVKALLPFGGKFRAFS